jgi:hypothetical protein
VTGLLVIFVTSTLFTVVLLTTVFVMFVLLFTVVKVLLTVVWITPTVLSASLFTAVVDSRTDLESDLPFTSIFATLVETIES